MWIADGWKDYELIDCGGGEKLERWGDKLLVRPDPQAIWNTPRHHHGWKRPDGRYLRSSAGGGSWEKGSLPGQWQVRYKNLTFQVKPMNFKHTGLFPEQAVNWEFAQEQIKRAGRPVSVLNLFAYTGAASVACAAAGHVFVDNSSPSAIRRTMAKAERTLQGGMSVVVFPEGSRTRTGRMRPFHKGAYQLSMEFGLPVVPVTIDGAFDVLPRGSWLPRPGRIKLTIHPPVDPPVDEADRRRVIDASYEAVHSALPPRHQ